MRPVGSSFNCEVAMRWWSLLLTAAVVADAAKLNPIIVRGNKMYDSKTGKRFFMRGITYDYDVSDDHYATWSKVAIETALAPIMGSFNTFRLYNVNPDKTYDQFMEHMESIGVYVMIAASPANVEYFGPYRYSTITKGWGPDGAVVAGQTQKDQTKTCYPALLLYYGKLIIKDFAKYDNTLGVIQYVADLKNWMRVNVKLLRILPLAYAGADSAPDKASVGMTAAALALQPDQYTVVKIMGLLCGDTMVNGVMQSSIDMYLVNEYRWCNDGKFATYETFLKMATGVPIVMGIGETGCDTQKPRKWTNVPYLFSSSKESQGFTDVYSGGYAYTFGSASLGTTGYPLFLGGGTDIVSKPGTTVTADFTNLAAMYKANPSDVQMGGFTADTICTWEPPKLPAPVTPLAAKSGWLGSCTNPSILLKPTDKWTTNTRQGAVCTKDGQTCEVTLTSKLGTSEEDLCGKVLEVVSGGGSCTPSSNTCGKHGQCVASADGKTSSCQCVGCWSGLSCSVIDQNKCSKLASDPNAPKYIFTGVGIFLGIMTLVFGGLGIVAGKKSQELKMAEQRAANHATASL
ncbi:hypothetical protein SPRG_10322 [Saprolegnia parasitica CBS 223.65]|uniref:EGF-like domain-containing protein n=1 Tax=Saprolegnia parasitica (strain CBS 223.65) TaxID=695850 RepID=A0A067CD71_SAPPC|nr:hypothetical protein SPRG_10322 [Saprolegnia parasitica CBS 223.65]KDO24506.1 hypothetical protein SPRG_10322 [Saprolegnia parasitica CBS 223.65]|eukprot:XP_012204770.1 hypothetical protein SPRG_10322 [Saprolegnia parasitica CBS 223.65]